MPDILDIQDLKIHFKSAVPEHYAVDGVSLRIGEGEILGLVGESGSGKSVTAMTISGLLSRKFADFEGSVRLAGTEMIGCSGQQLRQLQGNDVAVVFQEPMTSMNPTMKIGPQIEESLRLHTDLTKQERRAKAIEAMREAELPDPEELYNKYPHELSGGMLQRAMIAAAIISRPKLLLADEPTTALDVTIQAQILQLLKKLNAETGMAILFISHNLNVVRKLCTRVAVMQKGRLVEEGTVEEIFHHPQEAYTRRLIAAIPTRERRLVGTSAKTRINQGGEHSYAAGSNTGSQTSQQLLSAGSLCS